MTTATSARPSTSELQGQVLAEAARRMLPVLSSKLLAAVADRAEASIDALADRLGDLAENAGSRQEKSPAVQEEQEGQGGAASGGLGGILGTVATMALEQARAFLDLVVRLLAQAAAAARTAAARLRARRAPEGIDSEPAAIEGADDEFDDEYEDDDELVDEDDDELVDEDEDVREPATV